MKPPTPICTPGSVLDPDINECVLENPPQVCPDGSIPQSTGPGGTRPECPPFEAEQPSITTPDETPPSPLPPPPDGSPVFPRGGEVLEQLEVEEQEEREEPPSDESEQEQEQEQPQQ